VLVELDIPKADPPSTATVPSPEPSAPSNSLLKDLAGAAINSVPPAIGLAAALVERSNIRAQKNNAKLAALSASKVAKARADEDEDKKAILNDVEL
jgi:hypothetical protein